MEDEETSEGGKGLPLMTVAALVVAAAVGATVGLAVGIVADVHTHDRLTGILTLAVVVAGGAVVLGLVVRELQAEHRRSVETHQRDLAHHQDVIESMVADIEADERRHLAKAERDRAEIQRLHEELAAVRAELASLRRRLVEVEAEKEALIAQLQGEVQRLCQTVAELHADQAAMEERIRADMTQVAKIQIEHVREQMEAEKAAAVERVMRGNVGLDPEVVEAARSIARHYIEDDD